MVGVFQDVDAAGHFIVGDIQRNRPDVRHVVNRILGQNCHKIGLAHKLQQYVDLVQLYVDP